MGMKIMLFCIFFPLIVATFQFASSLLYFLIFFTLFFIDVARKLYRFIFKIFGVQEEDDFFCLHEWFMEWSEGWDEFNHSSAEEYDFFNVSKADKDDKH